MNTMTDAELEQHIADCGRLMQESMAEGDRAKADAWRVDMEHAIAMRSPEQIARMEAARGLSEPCYFDTMGKKHREELEAQWKGPAAPPTESS